MTSRKSSPSGESAQGPRKGAGAAAAAAALAGDARPRPRAHALVRRTRMRRRTTRRSPRSWSTRASAARAGARARGAPARPPRRAAEAAVEARPPYTSGVDRGRGCGEGRRGGLSRTRPAMWLGEGPPEPGPQTRAGERTRGERTQWRGLIESVGTTTDLGKKAFPVPQSAGAPESSPSCPSLADLPQPCGGWCGVWISGREVE